MKPEDVRVCVMRIEGTNAEDEMADAFAAVGAQAEKVHLKQLIGQSSEMRRRSLDALIEMMGITPLVEYATDELLEGIESSYLPFDKDDVESVILVGFLKKCFQNRVYERWNVKRLMNVSGME